MLVRDDGTFTDVMLIATTGAAVTEILPPISRLATGDGYGTRKQTVLDKLTAFFDRYFALGQERMPVPILALTERHRSLLPRRDWPRALLPRLG